MGVLALVVSGATLATTLLLKSAQQQAAIDLRTEASQIAMVDVFNPLTWGGVFTNIREVPEAIGAWIRFQAITVTMVFVAIGGSLLSGFIIWRDYFGGPTGSGLARTAAAFTPAGRAARVAKAVVAPEDNPKVSFAKGTRGRAVRDLLAKRVAAAGGAREPFAVATERVKEKGTRAFDIPESEIQAEIEANG